MTAFAAAGTVSTKPADRMLIQVKDISAKSGQPVDETALPGIVGALIGSVVSVLATVLICYLLYGGYLWMTAQGDEKQVQKGRDVIKNAIIGLLVVSLSFAISTFVIGQLVTVTSPATSAGGILEDAAGGATTGGAGG